jgi:exodeoxyribonuclease VII large subunit
LCRALDRIEAYPGLDAIIIGRGGGSLEDLMAFNDERLVRRVARCTVPTVSAVGHEIDTSLCDLAADARAATPSHAAELLVADSGSRLREFDVAKRRLHRAMRERLREDVALLEALRARISDPRYLVAEKQQSLDELVFRLERKQRQLVRDGRSALFRVEQRLAARHPRAVVQGLAARLHPLELRLRHALLARLGEQRQSIARQRLRLDALSPLSVLGRGYAIVLDASGRAVTESRKLAVGEQVRARLHRGSAALRVTELDPAPGSAEQ